MDLRTKKILNKEEYALLLQVLEGARIEKEDSESAPITAIIDRTGYTTYHVLLDDLIEAAIKDVVVPAPEYRKKPEFPEQIVYIRNGADTILKVYAPSDTTFTATEITEETNVSAETELVCSYDATKCELSISGLEKTKKYKVVGESKTYGKTEIELNSIPSRVDSVEEKVNSSLSYGDGGFMYCGTGNTINNFHIVTDGLIELALRAGIASVSEGTDNDGEYSLSPTEGQDINLAYAIGIKEGNICDNYKVTLDLSDGNLLVGFDVKKVSEGYELIKRNDPSYIITDSSFGPDGNLIQNILRFKWYFDMTSTEFTATLKAVPLFEGAETLVDTIKIKVASKQIPTDEKVNDDNEESTEIKTDNEGTSEMEPVD